VNSYRIVVTNESGTRRYFETTRASSTQKRGFYGSKGETPPGKYKGDIRRDGTRGFRIEFRDVNQPKNSGIVISPNGVKRTNLQSHRCGGISEGCPLFPKNERDRFEKTIEALLAEDKENGYGEVINVTIAPRNGDDKPFGGGDVKPDTDKDGNPVNLPDQNGRKRSSVPKPPPSSPPVKPIVNPLDN
jgi:hypothetical protein